MALSASYAGFLERGAGLDPCGQLQTSLGLEPDERVEVRIFLGRATSVL